MPVPKISDPVEVEVVGVVEAVDSADAVVEGRSADGDDVGAVEEPIHVQETVLGLIRIVKQDRADGPLLQVRRVDEGQRVAYTSDPTARAFFFGDPVGQRPVERAGRGRVAPGDYSPGAPTDPYVPTLEHTVPRLKGFATGRTIECMMRGRGSG